MPPVNYGCLLEFFTMAKPIFYMDHGSDLCLGLLKLTHPSGRETIPLFGQTLAVSLGCQIENA